MEVGLPRAPGNIESDAVTEYRAVGRFECLEAGGCDRGPVSAPLDLYAIIHARELPQGEPQGSCLVSEEVVGHHRRTVGLRFDHV
jgi:hypothetical protein